MRVWDNGVYRDMTPEEIEEFNRFQQDQSQEEPPPTVEDRVQILEEALDLLLSGETS